MSVKTPLERVTLQGRVAPLLVGLFVVLAIIASIGVRLPMHTDAATLATINFQARLQTNTGALVPDGNYNVQFKLYNVSSGGSALWTETYQNSASQGVTVKNGYLTTNLGSLTSFPGTINWDQDLYLTMNIGGTSTGGSPTYDGEMTPRLKLTGVPYAFKAGQLAKLTGGNTSTLDFATQTGANSILLPDESGTICIQNSANCGFLTGASASGSFIQLQGGTPGTAQTGNFNITGTGIAGILQAATINATTAFKFNGTTGATTTCTSGDVLTNIVVQGGIVTAGTCGAGGGGFSGVTLQATTPGTADTGNFNITGTGIAAIFKAADFDRASAGTLTFGNTNATTINIASNNAAHTINVGTGTGAQTINIGSLDSTSALRFKSGTQGTGFDTMDTYAFRVNGTAFVNTTTDGSVYLQPVTDTTTAFKIQNSAGTVDIFKVDTISGDVWARHLTAGFGIASSNINLGPSYGTGNATTYLSPLGASISTSFNIENYDPTSYNSQIALGLPSGSSSIASSIALFDARTSAHRPTIALLSPDETQVFGLSWDGSNTTAAVKTSSAGLNFNVGNTTTVLGLLQSGSNAIAQLGNASSLTGKLVLANASSSSLLTLQAGATVSPYALTLPTALGSTGDCLKDTGSGALGFSSCTGGFSGVTLQATTPGTADTGNFNITGTGIAAIFKAADFDRASAGTLTFGNTNATTINIATNAAAHTIAIGTGAAIQGITIGSTNSSSALTLQTGTGAFNLNMSGTIVMNIDSDGRTTFKPINDGVALKVRNAADTDSTFSVNTTTDKVYVNNLQTTYNIQTATLSFSGSSALSYVTPQGTSIPSKINIPNYDPGAFGQIVAMGVPSTTANSSRVITFFDARTGIHQPSIALFNPAESDLFGLSWDGSNSNALLKTLASGSSISLRPGASNYLALTAFEGGNVRVGSTTDQNPSDGGAILQVQNDFVPASVSGNGTTGRAAITAYGQTGGNTSGTTGQTAGYGGGFTLQAGNGGAASTGSTNGNGGSLTLQGGAPGAGSGTAGTYGNVILQASGGKVGIGNASPSYPLDVTGNINSTTGYRYNGAAGSTTTCTSGDVLTNIVVQGGIVTAGTCGAGGGSFSGVTLQGTTPGTADVGNFNITGTGIAATFYASDFDRASAGTLTIGNTNATTINIGTNAAAHTTNIATGAAAQSVSIGSTNTSSILSLQTGTGGFSLNTSGTTTFSSDIYGRVIFKPANDNTSIFRIQDASANDLLNISSGTNIVQLGAPLQSNYLIQTSSYINLTNGSTTSFVTPQGSSVPTKINIATYDPGNAGQVLALGIPASTANANSRVISVFDARTYDHQPSIALLSTNESNIFGLSYDGSNTIGVLKNTGSGININVGGVSAASISQSGSDSILALGSTASYNGKIQLANAGTGSLVTLQAGATAAPYSILLPTNVGTAGQCLNLASVGSGTETLGYSTCLTDTTGLQLQASTPGTAQTGNFNISGTGILGTAVLTPRIDTASGVTLNVGNTNASAISLGNTSSNIQTTVNGTALFKPTSGNDSTTAFRIQNAAGTTTLFTADTTNSQLVVGTTSNGIILSSTGLQLKGTARNAKVITLTAEYAGAVLDAGTGSNNTGTMISGLDLTNRMNYYKWTTTQGSNQSYDVVLQVPIPSDFDAWNSNPLSITGYTSNTTNGTITLETRDTGGSVICNFVSVTPGSTSTWTTNNSACTLSSGTYTAGGYMTIRVRMQSPTSGDVRIGNIVLSYLSKF